MELVVKIDLRFESSQTFDEVANMPLQHLPQKSEAIIKTHSNICEGAFFIFFNHTSKLLAQRYNRGYLYSTSIILAKRNIWLSNNTGSLCGKHQVRRLKNLQCGQLLLFLSTSQINQPDVKIVKSCKSDHLNYFLMSLSLLYQVSK